jgi:hypothetical protein
MAALLIVDFIVKNKKLSVSFLFPVMTLLKSNVITVIHVADEL